MKNKMGYTTTIELYGRPQDVAASSGGVRPRLRVTVCIPEAALVFRAVWGMWGWEAPGDAVLCAVQVVDLGKEIKGRK